MQTGSNNSEHLIKNTHPLLKEKKNYRIWHEEIQYLFELSSIQEMGLFSFIDSFGMCCTAMKICLKDMWEGVLIFGVAKVKKDISEWKKLCEMNISTIKEVRELVSCISLYKRIHFTIVENINEMPSIENVGEMLNISIREIRKEIKEKTGKSFAVYTADIRVGIAKRMLRETELSIQEISDKTGYSDRSAFFRAFKEREQISPSKYRYLENIKGK